MARARVLLAGLASLLGIGPRRRVVRTELRPAGAGTDRPLAQAFNARLPRQMNREQRRRWAARVWESRRKRRAA